MQVHLVDGTYELFRCFFGAPPSKAPDGREVGAVRGLVATLLSLLRDDGTTHVAAAFDTVIESFRNTLFDGYKTGAGIDPNLWAQFPLAEEATRALGIVTWSMIDFEADDALATFAHRLAGEETGKRTAEGATKHADVERVLICSPDKDLCQCVVDGIPGKRAAVQLFDRRQSKKLDVAAVREKHGVRPESIPDLLALVGDTADGIPGIPGFGAKTAAALLQRWRRLEDIPVDAGAWDVKVRGADKLAPVLAEHRDDAALYKVLATLRTDVPLAEKLDDLRWQGPDDARLATLAHTLGDAKLVERVAAVWNEKRR